MNKEKILLLKKLSSLLEIDLPISEALLMSIKYCKNIRLKKSIEASIQLLQQGSTLSHAMSQHRLIWDAAVISLIWSGELSGKLSLHISDAAKLLQTKSDFSKKIISAMIYPIILFCLSTFLIFFLLFCIYPKIIPILIGMKIPLPLTTKIILLLIYIIKNYFIYAVALSIFLSCLFIIFKKKYKSITSYIHISTLHIPFVGPIIRDYHLSLISRNIGTISGSELGLVKALSISEEAVTYQWAKYILRDIHYSVAHGKKITESLSNHSIVPNLWNELLSIGERTSKLPEMFLKIADIHEQDVSEKITQYTKLIEPLMLICTGFIVSIIALSIITPMYSITQYVH